jgi:hypothetical protein
MAETLEHVTVQRRILLAKEISVQWSSPREAQISSTEQQRAAWHVQSNIRAMLT